MKRKIPQTQLSCSPIHGLQEPKAVFLLREQEKGEARAIQAVKSISIWPSLVGCSKGWGIWVEDRKAGHLHMIASIRLTSKRPDISKDILRLLSKHTISVNLQE